MKLLQLQLLIQPGKLKEVRSEWTRGNFGLRLNSSFEYSYSYYLHFTCSCYIHLLLLGLKEVPRRKKQWTPSLICI